MPVTLASYLLASTGDWEQIGIQATILLLVNNLPLSIWTNLRIFFLLLLIYAETIFQYEQALDSLLRISTVYRFF
jgi:hypothetical protein